MSAAKVLEEKGAIVEEFDLSLVEYAIPTYYTIAMTANAFEEDAKECINAGMNAHMAKPLDMDVLIDMIAGYCNK